MAHPDAKKNEFAFRRPRHTLTGRQDAQAVARARTRLGLLQQQAEVGDIDLLYQDESECLTHPYLARTWAKRGEDLRIQAPGQAKKCAMFGCLDWGGNRLLVTTSAKKRSAEFIQFLEYVDTACGTVNRIRPLVMVLDNGPIHTSKASTAALAARPWITVEWLPKYAPEANAIERTWKDLKENDLAQHTFTSVDDLARQIHLAVAERNQRRSRSANPSSVLCLSG
jgi:transposase